MIWSACLAQCQVAQGLVDSYTQQGICIWDVAAGSLLVTEAGGVVMDVAGNN